MAAAQAEEVHGEEGHIGPDERIPEVEFAPPFVDHVSGPFRRPKVIAGEQDELRPRHQHVMEVRDDVVSILHLDIDGRHGEDEPALPVVVHISPP
jgi:hypothetical protein